MNKQTESISADKKLRRCMHGMEVEGERKPRKRREVMESQGRWGQNMKRPFLDRWLSVHGATIFKAKEVIGL